MIFVQQHTQVPVPRVFALYQDDDGTSLIVMERIHGHTLQEAWHTFGRGEKKKIAMQLKRHIGELRAVESPGGYCTLDHKPLRKEIFWTP